MAIASKVFARHTLVWNGILVAVFFLCPVTDLLATVALIGLKFCLMVHITKGQIFSPLGMVATGSPNPKFWPFDRECLENGKLQHYTSIRSYYRLDEGFLKCKSQSGSPPPRECTPVWRVCVLLTHLFFSCSCAVEKMITSIIMKVSE